MGTTGYSELVLEKTFIDQLVQQGYEYIKISNTETGQKDINENIRKQLSKLNHRDFTENDIKEILREIDIRIKKSGMPAYEFNEIMMHGLSVPKIVDNSRPLGKDNTASVFVFDTNDMHNNTFQVANQITDTGARLSRYDITILINGFPMVSIELKKPDIELNEAINQINKYMRRAYTGIFQYIQLFVVANGNIADPPKYGINNNTKLEKLFMFKWTDAENQVIRSTTDFVKTFLSRQNLWEMLSMYIEKYNVGHKRMVVLRPYQIWAIRAAMRRITASEHSLNGSLAKNGFIWHTTGSGKTLTSWKCVKQAAKRSEIAKVIYLVDRRDLNSQTLAEFKDLAGDRLNIDNTENTQALLKSMDSTDKIIITTIQKLSIAIKMVEEGNSRYSQIFRRYADRRIVFIIDECHRTQYGEMSIRIRRFFTNSIMLGFTGTPIFDENKGANGVTTGQLFGGKELHSYRISEAIADKNVLGFNIEYYNTLKKSANENNKDKLVETINTDEAVLSNTRIKQMVDKIYEIHNGKTQNRKYTALFAVESIKELLLVYDEFKNHNKQLEDSERLNISAIFTSVESDVETDPSITKPLYDKIMVDFSKESGISCKSEDTFRAELVKGLKRESSYQLDIVIVVGIFLTGFDSKFTNTLYVDKELKYHNLLQAFSRTNRIESESKSYGNIVCFRNIREDVENAIKLFSTANNSNVIMESYDSILRKLLITINLVMKTVPDNLEVSNVEITKQEQFIQNMRNLNRQINEAKQYIDFNWEDISDKTQGIAPGGFNEQIYAKLVNEMREIKNKINAGEVNPESILNDIDFVMELVATDIVDVDYIKRLIYSMDFSSLDKAKESVAGIKKRLSSSTDESLTFKKTLIERFLDHMILDYNNIDKKNFNIETHMKNWMAKECEKAKEEKAKDTGIKLQDLEKEIETYDAVDKIDIKHIDAMTKDAIKEKEIKGIKEKKKFRDGIVSWIKNIPKLFYDMI